MPIIIHAPTTITPRDEFGGPTYRYPVIILDDDGSTIRLTVDAISVEDAQADDVWIDSPAPLSEDDEVAILSALPFVNPAF